MKIFMTLALAIILVGCTASAPDTSEMPPAPMPGEDTTMEPNDDDMLTPDEDMMADEMPDLDLSNGVMLYDFQPRQMIESPLELRGVAPRAWFFEGVIPITLMTLAENIVKEWYGTGAWIEFNADGELEADDPIEFTATIEFETPPMEVLEVSDLGKIRIAQDATGLGETGQEQQYVETMIIWP